MPAQMFGLIGTVTSMALSPLWPAYGEAIARGDHDWVKQTLYRSIILSVGVAACLSATLVFAGPWLLKLWVGKEINPPFLLILGLGTWKIVEAGGNAAAMYLNGANIVRAQIVLATITGVATIGFKIFIVKEVGISGVPWSVIVTYLIFTAAPLLIIIPKIGSANSRCND